MQVRSRGLRATGFAHAVQEKSHETFAQFWLNLGWLVMLVVTIAVPLGLDAPLGRLTYRTSLALWGIPILLPTEPCLQRDHRGRHGAAAPGLALELLGTIVVLGIISRLRVRISHAKVPGLQRAVGC